MKRLLMFVAIIAIALPLHASEKKMIPKYNTITKTWTSYALVSIHDIEFVAPESLAVADAIGDVASRSSLQWSNYYHDTVVTRGIIVMAGGMYPSFNGLTFTQHGWSFLLHDLTSSNDWAGVLFRVGVADDTSDTEINKMLNFERGDTVEVTVRIEEFPDPGMNSTTQLRPIPGVAIVLVGSASSPPQIPVPTRLTPADFYSGAYPGGTVKFSTGEKYEGSLVEMVNLTINDIINPPRGTWQMTDAAGNFISDYDASHYFTLGNENPLIPGDPSFVVPPIGGVVDTIRGTILTVSGQENPRGYRISPLLPGDVKYGITLPSVTSHRRYPVVVSSSDSVRVQARVKLNTGGYPIRKAVLLKSINNGPWVADTMVMITPDSIYESLILDPDGNPLPVNTSVRYFFKGIDNHGSQAIYANSSSSLAADTGKGFFFYTVLDRPLTIHDIQYTPYANGRTGYLGGVATVSGIVTADTSDLLISPLNTGGTSSWYIQNGTAPWSGIWVVSKDTTTFGALSAMRRGDSVTVTGTIQENFDVTRILDSLITIHASGRPVPAPVLITTDTLGLRGNGDPVAEQYEGMLIKVVNATVQDTTLWTFSDRTEYIIDDGTGRVNVRRDGVDSYGNRETDTSLGKTHIIHPFDRVDTMTGIVFFSFSRYKIDPRKDNDFVVGDPDKYAAGWNMGSVGRTQMPASNYATASYYPGAVSSTFNFSASAYHPTTTLNNKDGFWVKMLTARTIHHLGAQRTRDTIAVVPGWNLVSALSKPVLTSGVIATPAGNHPSAFFEYANGYIIQDSLIPSKAYWVKSDSTGTIIEASSSMMPKASTYANPHQFNTLTITDKDGAGQTLYFGQDAEGVLRLSDYEMPPFSPSEKVLDVRYASGRILETYPKVVKDGMTFMIDVNAQRSPLTIQWNIVNQDGKRFRLATTGNGAAKELSSTGKMTVAKSGSFRMNLSIEGGVEIPKTFALSQNYPNPFNPTTTFEVSLPIATHLEIAIFNVLGQRVNTLVDGLMDAGYHSIQWNGTTHDGKAVSSGLYFVRMTADNPSAGSGQQFSGLRKMMLLK